jgi:hypothetical protein
MHRRQPAVAGMQRSAVRCVVSVSEDECEEQVGEKKRKSAALNKVSKEKRRCSDSIRAAGAGGRDLGQPQARTSLGESAPHFQFCRPAARGIASLETSSFRRRLQRSREYHPSRPNTVAMAPKKAPVRAPQENISLGPQVREGKNRQNRDTRIAPGTIR